MGMDIILCLPDPHGDEEIYTAFVPEELKKYAEEVEEVGVKLYRLKAINIIETRYPYFNNEFKISPFSLDLPEIIFDPKEMDKWTHIFKNPDRWNMIKEAFQKFKKAAPETFVWICY